MAYKGHVKNGVVVLDERASLPDGTEVEVLVVPQAPQESQQSLREFLLSFAGKCPGLPPDLARNHDHYLHGMPKK